VARERLFLLGHSQGGLIAALWGLSRRRVASGFVLSSPYLSLAHRVPFAKVLGAKLIGKVVPWFPLSTGLRGEDLTADPELAAWTNGDPLYCRSTTPRWVAESGKAQREVLRRKGEWRAPLLVLAAGADGVAETSVTRAFVDGCGGDDKEMRVYASFRHEIFNEVERDRPIGDAVAWLVQRSG
jgi:alpha-beta hydrolase superfamily lysophospholipase